MEAGGGTGRPVKDPGCQGCQGCPAAQVETVTKNGFVAHTLTLTRTRTRPTQALSKNGSPSWVAKIKEPLGGQPPGGNIAPVAFVVQRALRNLQTPLGTDPGLRWRVSPQLEVEARTALNLPGLAGRREPRGARLAVLSRTAALVFHFHS